MWCFLSSTRRSTFSNSPALPGQTLAFGREPRAVSSTIIFHERRNTCTLKIYMRTRHITLQAGLLEPCYRQWRQSAIQPRLVLVVIAAFGSHLVYQLLKIHSQTLVKPIPSSGVANGQRSKIRQYLAPFRPARKDRRCIQTWRVQVLSARKMQVLPL